MKSFLFGLLFAGLLDAADGSSSQFQAPAPTDILKPNVLFRLYGSNTIGSELAPSLAEAYLRQRGAGNVHYQPSNAPGQGIEIGTMPDDIGQVAIEINAAGSLSAPSHLAKGVADIAMMSTKMTPEDCTKLAPLGDMLSTAAENVLGADGIAVIVNRANTVNKLTVDQLRQIFSGQLTNWKDVGGIDIPIKLYGLTTASSGTYRTFESIVLKPEKLSVGAKQVAGNSELSNLVAHDPAGIGFVGMAFVRSARAVAIEFNAADGATQTLLPTILTVGPERYLLSRRLYLYLSPKSNNAEARQFVAFALSNSGQMIVEKKGFVSLKLRAERTKRQNNEPSPLGVAFRFRDGSRLLDDKALVDLDRVVEYVQSLDHPPTLLLIGHSDNLGSEDANLKLSKERAKVVADELRARGIDIGGTGGQGSKSPVASNDTPEGRQLNRRVEIWSRM